MRPGLRRTSCSEELTIMPPSPTTESECRAEEMRPELASALREALDIYEALQGRREALRGAVASGDADRVERAARALLGMIEP